MHCGRNVRFFSLTIKTGPEGGPGLRTFLLIAALAGGVPGGCMEERHKAMIALAPVEAPAAPATEVPPVIDRGRVTPKPAAQTHSETFERETPALNPVALLGIRPDAAIKLLGAPVNTEQQAMATKWIYRNGACSLAIFFYPDISNGALRVLRYDFVNAETVTTTGASCDRQIVLARNDK